MKKKLVLWVAVAAMMGLSACADDTEAEDCSNGDKRCDGIDLLICANNAWKIETQCDGDMVCNDDSKQCENAAACSDGDKRCDGIDLLSCANNAWKVESQCADGMICNANTKQCESTTAINCNDGDKRCDGIDVMICRNNGWKVESQCQDDMVCNDDTKQCQTATLTCKDGDKRCDGIDVMVCRNNGWKVESQCQDDMVCNDDTKQCQTTTPIICNAGEKRCQNNTIELCTDNTWTEERACGYKVCNPTTYACDDTQSMIPWCNSQLLDANTKVSYGRVLDNRDTKDPSTITAKLLCGTPGQAISEYRALAATQNKLCSSCDDTFEYIADLSTLRFGEYLCMWSFGIAGENAVACKTGEAGGIVNDFTTVPTATIALQYAPTGAKELWNTFVDFQNFKISLAFTNQQSITIGKVTTKIFGAIMGSPVEKIDRQTLVISNTAADGYVVISNTDIAKLDVLSFDYKSCGAENFGSNKRELKIYLDEDTTPVHTLKLEGKVNPAKNLSIEIHRNVKSVKIQKTYSGGGNIFPRLAIDNVRLTGTL